MQTRSEGSRVVVVDAGDFCGATSTSGSARGLFLLEAGKSMGSDAVTFGAGDAVLGADMLRSLASDPSIPLVSANLEADGGEPLGLPKSRIVEKDGVRVGITAVTVPRAAEAEMLAGVHVRARDARESLAPVLPELRRKADVVVLLARTSLDEAKVLVEGFPDLVDVVVIGALEPGRGLVGPENGGAVYVVAGDRGQAIGRARMAIGAGRKPEHVVADEILLTTEYAEDPGMRTLVDEFAANLNEMLKEEAVRTAQGLAAPDGSYYVGAASCGSCHKKEYDIWAKTPHAHAFQTLVDAHSDGLPECFKCHVTGAETPGGYVSGATEDLRNVQCEVCHGKGSHHARDGSWGGSLEKPVCLQCHDEGNSPDFDLDVYWQMIEH